MLSGWLIDDIGDTMDGIRAGGLGYPGGRSGHMGNSAMAGNMSHGFGSLGYAGGRTGFAAQTDNHAFGNTAQAANINNSSINTPLNTVMDNGGNNSPLKAINSVAFGRGEFNMPFFGMVKMTTILPLAFIGVLAYKHYK